MLTKLFIALACFLLSAPVASQAEVLAKEGQGYLELREGQRIIHLKGSPYEMGLQHGILLKDLIQTNISQFIDKPVAGAQSHAQEFLQHLPSVTSHIPPHMMDEIRGIADGSGVCFDKILMLNLFPEMFHCSGITLNADATTDGSLYHARLLDYSIGKTLQQTAVLMVVEPKGKIPYLNVSYAGFIGSVTGMNASSVAIGEMGGHGYGYWDGMPMAFLIRTVLENAHDLKEAQAILNDTPRTCEYYYVISDGKTNSSLGVYATASQIHFLNPGENYAILAPQNPPLNYQSNGENDKFFLTGCGIETSSHQTLLFDPENKLLGLMRSQLPGSLLMTGFAYPERYPMLIDRIQKNYGSIDEKALMQIIKEPVARPSNLHNAIFHPATLTAWIAHAGPNNEPACDQPYAEFSLPALLTQGAGD